MKMQEPRKVQFMKHHGGAVRSIAFSPCDRYLFCSGGQDGKLNLCSTLKNERLKCIPIGSGRTKCINSMKFTTDGSKILATSSLGNLQATDVETNKIVQKYHNCSFTHRTFGQVAADPTCANIAVCIAGEGHGLSLIDLRMPYPLQFYSDNGSIRDVTFLNPSWPWSNNIYSSVLTVDCYGNCKIISLSGMVVHDFFSGQRMVRTITTTPELFTHPIAQTFPSGVVCGGQGITTYSPNTGHMRTIAQQRNNCRYSRLRYSSNGSFLYSAYKESFGSFRRYTDYHSFLGILYTHKYDIYDFDISPYDEYAVTASKDGTVGVMLLGPPNHGSSSYCKYT